MTTSLTMLRIECLRQIRNPFTLIFTIVIPVFMYMLFGANAEYATNSAGHGNVSFYVMVSMAVYGVAVAMTSIASQASIEAKQGWGRQLAMTRLTAAGYALTKVIVSVLFALISLVAVFTAGSATTAQADGLWRWMLSAVLIVATGCVFALYGLSVGMLFNDVSAVSLASISLMFFAFLGNVFMPLDGVMLTIARFTPMYGFVSLCRWPLTDGMLTTGQTDSLGQVLASAGAWLVVFIGMVYAAMRRSTTRQ